MTAMLGPPVAQGETSVLRTSNLRAILKKAAVSDSVGRVDARPLEGPPAAGAREGRSMLRLGILLTLAAGLGFRIWILASTLGVLNSDESTVGLMARHLLDGEFRFFFWGQEYGGTAEVFLVAISFAILGPTRVALKLVPILESAFAAWLVWRVGRRTIGEPGAKVAAALHWAWPAFFVWFSTKEQLFYLSVVILGLLVTLAALRIVQDGPSLPDCLLLGFAAGVGWWSSAQIVFFVAPIGIWLAWRLRGRLLSLAPALFSFAGGALPWIYYNVRNSFVSLNVPPIPAEVQPNGYLDHLVGFFSTGLPISLGLKIPFANRWVLPFLASALYVFLLGLFVWRLGRPPRKTGPIFLTALLYPLIFAASPLSWHVVGPRYLVFLMPAVAILMAAAFVAGRAGRWVPAAGLTFALALTLTALLQMDRSNPVDVETNVQAPHDLSRLIDALDREDINRVYANYWIAYRLSFETGERIIARPFVVSRYPPYASALRASARVAYVFPSRWPAVPSFEASMRRANVSYRTLSAQPFLVFLPSRSISPEALGGMPGEQ
jgi:hypothetical protein